MIVFEKTGCFYAASRCTYFHHVLIFRFLYSLEFSATFPHLKISDFRCGEWRDNLLPAQWWWEILSIWGRLCNLLLIQRELSLQTDLGCFSLSRTMLDLGNYENDLLFGLRYVHFSVKFKWEGMRMRTCTNQTRLWLALPWCNSPVPYLGKSYQFA